MTEIDDKLLADFFAANRHEIADNGFTRNVMRRLPDRTRRISRVWATFGFTLALVMFIVLDGVQMVLGTVREVFESVVLNGTSEIDPKSLIIAGAVLIYFIYRKICSLA